MKYKIHLDFTVYLYHLQLVLNCKTIKTILYVPFNGLSFILPLNPEIQYIYYKDEDEFTCVLDFKFGNNVIERIYKSKEDIDNSVKIYEEDGWKVELKTYEDLNL